MRIVVLGANGQLGAAVSDRARARGHETVRLTRPAVDVTDADRTTRTLVDLRPDAIVNCTADNAVDAAELDLAHPFALNMLAVRTLARVSLETGAALVHYSTDFVFDGRTDRPYQEQDPPRPLNVFGRTKLMGEAMALMAPRAYVLRLASLFGRSPEGPAPRGTIAALTRTITAGDPVHAISDRMVSPTSVLDAARATLDLLERTAAPGTYHCVSSGYCSWLELAEYLAGLLQVPARIVPVRSADVVLPAARPLFAALSNGKLREAGILMPGWKIALYDAVSSRALAA
jgi:dTDP-4-dehydrorhamnose reductase